MSFYLIIKLGAIGDVAMASIMAAELRKVKPDARLVWVVGSAARPLLEATGIVEEIITADEDAILHGSLPQKIRAVWSVLRKLGRCWQEQSGRTLQMTLPTLAALRYCRNGRAGGAVLH